MNWPAWTFPTAAGPRLFAWLALAGIVLLVTGVFLALVRNTRR
jgi:uncharacterized protein involved in exopolysaccharide biosynthesis